MSMSESLLVFNELSLPNVPPDIRVSGPWLESFRDLLADTRYGPGRVLVTPPNFLQFLVAADHTLGRWLRTAPRGDEPRSRRVKLLFDRRRDFSYLGNPNDDNCDYRYWGRLAQGLPLAFREDGLAISFCSEAAWDLDSISFEKSWVVDGDVASCTLLVLHASRLPHLESHAELLSRWNAGPRSGREIWERRAELFPNLDFCDSVQGQVRELNGTEARFKVALQGFRHLQLYCESWETAYFDIHRLGKASGESESTLNMYSAERTFRCPDGEWRVFQWHLKKGDTRIHFFDLPATKRLIVGYVGDHLSISSQ